MFLEEAESDPEALARATRYKDQADRLIHEINGLKAILAQKEEQLKDIIHRHLPEAMADAKIPLFKTSSGVTLELVDIIEGTWPKDEEKVKQAVAWLEQEKLTDLIKATVQVEFDKGDRTAALEFFSVAKGNNAKKSATFKEGVHHQTLNAVLRKRMKEGQPVPTDVFSCFVGKIVKMKEPK